MSFLNDVLPWRRRKIEAVKRILDSRPRLGPLSNESLERVLIAIADLRDTRGLRIYLDVREVLSKEFVEQNLLHPLRTLENRFMDQAAIWSAQKKTRP
jgi:hypothetical protein